MNEEDSFLTRCPNCYENLYLNLTIKYQEEKNSNEIINKQETVLLLPPSSNINNFKSLADYTNYNEFDVNSFVKKYASSFWSAFLLFKENNLEYEFMLPYYNQILPDN